MSTDERLERMRHSASHVMAEAVQQLFPGTKFGIGPAIEDGFYYDFELPRPLTADDLPVIEQRMREIVAADLPFSQNMVSRDEARTLFAGQPYKLELLDELEDEQVSLFQQGSFTDLCRGPHVESTGQIGAFKLTRIAGAYWRGDETRPMLQRAYGVAFATEDELDEYLERLAEAAKRDHRKLGRDLDLFSIHEEIGPGLVCWHPNGAMVRQLIEDFWKAEHHRRGYGIVYTPHVGKLDQWKQSGHWEFYRENLYSPMEVDNQQYLIKPMNCLGHILIYKTRVRSYRELPIRMAELGTVYRYERGGVLYGLTRVRGFTQDDAHIFCRQDQIQQEVIRVIELARFMLNTFGFADYQMVLATRPDKFAGTEDVWEQATDALKSALETLELPYEIDPGGGAFYGPKIDVKLADAMGRGWQGPTIQVDFNLPQRFDVCYIGDDGSEHLVTMIHRTVLGSMERFFACLVEHYGGAFPVWLSPIQARIIPIADRHIDYAREVEDTLRDSGVRTDVDSRSERMTSKIRDAQLSKIPYMLIVGDKEAGAGGVAVRLRTGEDLGLRTIAEVRDEITAAGSPGQTV
ncbi:MAG: threonine--tRNA ligase [Chloroflexota bacterium]